MVWGGEFGRGFTIWMAGVGIKAGLTIATTDEIGLRAVNKPYHVHDVHSTILNQLGLDHKSLTFLHSGRGERATINGGNLITELL